MRLHRTGLSIIATATLGMSAPTAHADTQYGGTGFKGSRPTGPTTTLVGTTTAASPYAPSRATTAATPRTSIGW